MDTRQVTSGMTSIVVLVLASQPSFPPCFGGNP
ncbi:hypothetical protein CPS_3100 [Colwellia psychrerythraea 34H]|uniref:Uncharacterized protein n=1 Tax=Colwellia psychrerythraea (strain 34H / ATCC BAA-681) TaxID=167879 RepID=Q47ZH2_COLP3|nr:hypothetical protein CPS_3100 [Colwellia psychrerythraea 34H]